MTALRGSPTVRRLAFFGSEKTSVEIGSGEFRLIALRINRRASVVDKRLAETRRAIVSMRAHLHHTLEYRTSYAKHPLLWLADRVLCEMLAEELDGVRIRPVSGFDQSWETTEEELRYINSLDRPPYAPTDSFTCPDLLSALYLQLFLVVRRRRPVRRCEGCGLPLPETARRGKLYHDATCRSNARHRRERATSMLTSGS